MDHRRRVQTVVPSVSFLWKPSLWSWDDQKWFVCKHQVENGRQVNCSVTVYCQPCQTHQCSCHIFRTRSTPTHQNHKPDQFGQDKSCWTASRTRIKRRSRVKRAKQTHSGFEETLCGGGHAHNSWVSLTWSSNVLFLPAPPILPPLFFIGAHTHTKWQTLGCFYLVFKCLSSDPIPVLF